MSRLFYHVMQDNLGNLLFDVSGTMRLAGTGTAATIYGDEALSVPIANPMTNHPSFGSFKCYLGAGSYDFYMAKSGYTFETLTGLQGWGTMALQNANNVAVTGGNITGLGQLGADIAGLGTAPVGGQSLTVGGGLTRITGHAQFDGNVAMGEAISTSRRLSIVHDKNAVYGLAVRGTTDGGSFASVLFLNTVAGAVGSITTTGSATAYNTTSDARLKHDVEALTGELDLIRALRPVSFLWKSDDSPGVGFLAHEVAAHVQGVITGEPDAVDDAGGIIPQMIDYSKLVPFLVGALQTLTARVAVLEDALGI